MKWTNDDRANRGFDAVVTGSDYHADEDMLNAIGDTLANIMHLCERDGIDFQNRLAVAEDHFKAELADEQVA